MLRFGKHPPKFDYRTLRLANYLTPQLPDPPASYNALTQVFEKLDTDNVEELFPMDGNDVAGDCTIAAMAHAITIYGGRVGKSKIMSTKSCLSLYRRLTGGPDTGLNMLDVLKYFQKTGVRGERILAFAAVDIHNHKQVQQAIHLFGGLDIGFQVPAGCQQQFENRQPWKPGRLTEEGHAVFSMAYNSTEVDVFTWGNTQRATWAWWDECVDEAYAILPPEAALPGFAPGFNFSELKADLAILQGDDYYPATQLTH
jgi:hypothetical protein